MIDGDQFPEAPACPAWCQDHEPGEGWDVRPAAVTKTCRRVVPCDNGVEITIERFASIEGYALDVGSPVIRVECDEALSLADALTLSRTLLRAGEMASEPAVAAA